MFEKLDQTQQGIIIHSADDPALIIAAIGSNEAELNRLSEIKNPIDFAKELGKIEGKGLNMVNRRSAPAPEKMVREGTAPKSGVNDSTLQRLRDEAAKTGDYSKVTQYRRDKARQSA